MTPAPFSVAVIGAGFSGALLTVHLLHRCRPDDRVYLIERRAGFGRGLAYSTNNQQHLLNVRAGNMSAFLDRPEHFTEWLRQHAESLGEPPPGADAFVSRRLYGTYVRSLLCDELWAGGKGRNLFLVPDQAVAVNDDAEGVSLTVAGGRCYRVDALVLAAGNLPPAESRGAYFGDPWDPRAVQGIGRRDPVLLIGTGLTMIDIVQSLLANGHQGAVQAVSRRGLLPQVHAPTRALEIAVDQLPRTTSAARLTRWLREAVRSAEAEGHGWRAVIDGLRPHTQDLWRRLPIEERRRFLRHLRPWWDVHRHRMAPAVAAQVHAAIARGQLTIGRGRVVEITPAETSVTVSLRRRGAAAVETVEVARAINCSGPASNYGACRDPLIGDLLARRFARPDPLGLGLEVSEQGALLNGDGRPSRRLFALGPVTRGTFWEIVAVPDIRLHCARLANHLSSVLQNAADSRQHAEGNGHPASGTAVQPIPRRPPSRGRPLRAGVP
jgi:uncharacterized NAD(P)/FAD-binding protein YdhS